MKKNIIRTIAIMGLSGLMIFGSAISGIKPMEVYAIESNNTELTIIFHREVYTREEFVELHKVAAIPWLLGFEGNVYTPAEFFDAHNGRAFREVGFSNELTSDGVRVMMLELHHSAMNDHLSVESPIQNNTDTPMTETPSTNNIDNSPIGSLIISEQQRISTVGQLTTEALNSFDNVYALFTSNELIQLIAQAPSHQDTRSLMVMPNRALTDSELASWVAEYHALGGLNALELGVLLALNEVRAEYGLPPFVICINMSMAARLHSQEMADLSHLYAPRGIGHSSPNNGSAGDRGRMFGVHVGGENIRGLNRRVVCPIADAIIDVEAWLNSLGHKAGVLIHSNINFLEAQRNPEIELIPQVMIVGIGAVQNGGITFKFGTSGYLLTFDEFT